MKHFLLIVVCLVTAVPAVFSQRDTLTSKVLEEVEVHASRPSSSYRTASPQQILPAEQMSGALQVSDAVKHFAGVQVKDYGGVGGLKTVSVRSLGAHHTAVAYDGVAITDYQTGQVDLGRFSMDNVDYIRLTTGLSDNIFQPASNLASGGLIQLVTPTFIPTEHRRDALKAGWRSGSWKLSNPFFTYSRALGKAFVWNVSGEYLHSQGNYPFRMDGELRHRTHSEVDNRRLEANLTASLRGGGRLSVKAYYSDSDRNIPGAAVSNTTYSGESMRDRTAFVQVIYRQMLSSRWSLLSHMKGSRMTMRYAHQLYPDRNSCYTQQEVYGSLTLLYRPTEHWSWSWSNDGIRGQFEAIHTLHRFSPERLLVLSALSGQYETKRITMQVSGLYQSASDAAEGALPAMTRVHVSPSIGGSVQVVERWPLRLRASYRNTYRLPTFADLYYPTLPNTDLKPENAHQYNVGSVMAMAFGEALPYLSVSVDVYYNRIENKILAIPLSSLALWSVQNYGEAVVRGWDVNGRANVRLAPGFSAEVNANYTRQQVWNEKKQRLRYTPQHFATAFAMLKTPWFDGHYTLVYCGRRFYNETPSRQSLVESYVDQGISITKSLSYKDYRLQLSAECLNFTNRQYEVVHAYPMPGRSFRFGIKVMY
jgi:outer membrane cobalamin receptor